MTTAPVRPLATDKDFAEFAGTFPAAVPPGAALRMGCCRPNTTWSCAPPFHLFGVVGDGPLGQRHVPGAVLQRRIGDDEVEPNNVGTCPWRRLGNSARGRYGIYSNRSLPYSGSSECASAFFLISRSSLRSPTSSWISVSGTSADNHMCQQV